MGMPKESEAVQPAEAKIFAKKPAVHIPAGEQSVCYRLAANCDDLFTTTQVLQTPEVSFGKTLEVFPKAGWREHVHNYPASATQQAMRLRGERTRIRHRI